MFQPTDDAAPPPTLVLQPIDPASFAPFGTVLEAPAEGPRQDRATVLENGRPEATANLALIRSEPFGDVIPVRRLEKHPASSQAFLPLSVDGYVVIVAPDRDGRPDEGALRAFRVPGHVGINYRAGTWHAHMMTLHRPSTFVMLAYEDGSAGDCVFAPIAPVLISDTD